MDILQYLLRQLELPWRKLQQWVAVAIAEGVAGGDDDKPESPDNTEAVGRGTGDHAATAARGADVTDGGADHSTIPSYT